MPVRAFIGRITVGSKFRIDKNTLYNFFFTFRKGRRLSCFKVSKWAYCYGNYYISKVHRRAIKIIYTYLNFKGSTPYA